MDKLSHKIEVSAPWLRTTFGNLYTAKILSIGFEPTPREQILSLLG